MLMMHYIENSKETVIKVNIINSEPDELLKHIKREYHLQDAGAER